MRSKHSSSSSVSSSLSSAPKKTTTKTKNDDAMPVSSTHEAVFEKCVTAIVPDMPLLMHGAGDVIPQDVNTDTAVLLAQLTAEYVTKLVSAAVDAHDILTDGAGGILPPPTASSSREIHPLPYSEERKRKRKTPGEEYWDDPVPDPVIKASNAGSNNGSHRSSSSSTSSSRTHRSNGKTNPSTQPWVGLAGVDLKEVTRTCKRHVQQAIGT